MQLRPKDLQVDLADKVDRDRKQPLLGLRNTGIWCQWTTDLRAEPANISREVHIGKKKGAVGPELEKYDLLKRGGKKQAGREITWA